MRRTPALARPSRGLSRLVSRPKIDAYYAATQRGLEPGPKANLV
jgi:hypothetical protein